MMMPMEYKSDRLRKERRDMEKKKSRRVFTLRSSATQKEVLQKKARERNMTLNQFVISSLAQGLKV